MKYSTALVTGGAGFIGSHVAKKLIEEGLTVYILDNLSTGKKKNVPSGAILIEGDILDQKLVPDILKKGVDVVFHLAAKVTIRGSTSEFYSDAQTNIMGTLNVLSSCMGTSVKKFIFSSSMAVYGDSPTPDPIDENHVIAPYSPYGISKYACELYVKSICETAGIDSVILRYFNTYGPNQTFTPYVGAITIFITRILSNEPLTVFGDGRQCRDFVHVEDIAQGTVKAMHYKGKTGICNLGTGVGNNVNDVVAVVTKNLKANTKIDHAPRRAEELVNSVACIDKARSILGYSPKHKFPDKIDEVIEYIKTTPLLTRK